MADVNEDERGQLILVGGIVVAFALVALIVLLNTTLFAENVATRGLGPAPDRAYDYATFTDRAAEKILRHEERIEYESWANAGENFTRNLYRVNVSVRARQFQQHSSFATVEGISLGQGAVLLQTNRSRNFTNASGTDDWTLANTNGIRNFTMTVDATNTSSKSAPGNFTIVIQGNGGDGREWSAEVYENGTAVEVKTNNATCTSTASVATINWTDGDLANCSFPFAIDSTGDSLTSPYKVTFENGSNATGEYHMVVTNANDGLVSGSFADPGTDENPRWYWAVYSAHFKVLYEESTINYDTHVRAAPGESEQTSPGS